MTIPNLITSIRIILVPIFVINLIHEDFAVALFVFMLAALSDGIDGFVARVFNQKSSLGTYLDPMADKILLIAAFVFLAIIGVLPPWLTVVVISRDVLILLGVLFLSMSSPGPTIRPSFLGKLTTCSQLATVCAVLSLRYIPILAEINLYLFWLTGVLTISSGLHYMRQWFRMMGERSLKD